MQETDLGLEDENALSDHMQNRQHLDLITPFNKYLLNSPNHQILENKSKSHKQSLR